MKPGIRFHFRASATARGDWQSHQQFLQRQSVRAVTTSNSRTNERAVIWLLPCKSSAHIG